MAKTFIFARARRQLLITGMTSQTFQVILVGAGSTAEVEDATGMDAPNLSLITLDELDPSSGYTPGHGNRPTLSGSALVDDFGADISALKHDDITFTNLSGDHSSPCKGLIISTLGASDVQSFPIYYTSHGGFPFTGTGFDKVLHLPSPGWLILRSLIQVAA